VVIGRFFVDQGMVFSQSPASRPNAKTEATHRKFKVVLVVN
jgi:hypothetical protein